MISKECSDDIFLIGEYEFGELVVKDGTLSRDVNCPGNLIDYSDVPLAYLLEGYLEIYFCNESQQTNPDHVDRNVSAAIINNSNPFFGVFETCDLFSDSISEKHIPIFKNFQIIAGLRNIITATDINSTIVNRINASTPQYKLPAGLINYNDSFEIVRKIAVSNRKIFKIVYFTNSVFKKITKFETFKGSILLKAWEQSYNIRNDQYNINEVKQVLLDFSYMPKNDGKHSLCKLHGSVVSYLASLYIELIYVQKGIFPTYVPVNLISSLESDMTDPIVIYQNLLTKFSRVFSPNYPLVFIPWTISEKCTFAVHPLNKSTPSILFPSKDIQDGTTKAGTIEEVTMVLTEIQSRLPSKWQITDCDFFTYKKSSNRQIKTKHRSALQLPSPELSSYKLNFNNQPFKEFALITFK